MCEKQNGPFQLSFHASLKVGFQGSRVTSDGGLILVRELDERLGFSELIEQYLADSRGRNAQFCFADLLRRSVYSRLAGYEDLNDAERLSRDPTFRLIGSEKIWDRGACLEACCGASRLCRCQADNSVWRQSETNLDEGGELTKRCQKNRLETKQYAAFVSWRRPFPVCPSLWDENGCKERTRWGQLRI